MLDNVSLYGYITLCLPIHQFGSIMNNTAMNLHLQVLYGHMFSVFLGIYLGVELLDDMVTLCLTFSGIIKLFSKEVMYKDSSFFISSPILVIVIFIVAIFMSRNGILL